MRTTQYVIPAVSSIPLCYSFNQACSEQILQMASYTHPVTVRVSFITFALGRFGPGDPIQILMGQHSNPEVVQRIRAAQGLDDPVPLQYVRYVSNTLRGDFGESYQYRGRSVAELLLKKIPVSAQLNLAALMISLCQLPFCMTCPVPIQRVRLLVRLDRQYSCSSET